ncbi:MAG TPA: single-stranded-DNA-specific exonuclease RecJ [Ignavibacteriales bacterium]|nr:single-stranded-DNA-specific exonuclease RecJ [Ignavibacteriales bacterium]HPD68241.1 single-stranded-DNA-specific exonuclease RecJ [Ignavibacteriales bacterium]HRR19086.1 single-stranded-DNA-specific exonuclease RecJ [Ignavibacteriales bacterium]HRT98861.1 single-stranded-DNA-specific exonuclease RecJ [Ignavibacteriales bacterium]
MNKKWIINNNYDKVLVNTFIDVFRIPYTISKILVQRGLKDVQQVKKFFNPDLNNLYDPFELNGMSTAVNLIIETITNNKKILIYGDYDVDGVCAVAILKLFLEKLAPNIEIYIPNRLQEGYGVSKNGIDFAVDKQCQLLITVDCGITAVDEVKYAKEKGLKVIISDHHQPKEILPEADALLNPLLSSSDYPFKMLSGAGVAFKIIQAIAKKLGMKNDIYEYLDLVAIATAADIVPLVDENRILVHYGLESIKNKPRIGIKAILDKAFISHEDINVNNIIFGIAPRINAVGRLGNAMPSLDILTTNEEMQVQELADTLNQGNIQRRELDRQIMSEVIETIENNDNLKKSKILILHSEKWHSGVSGIIASRLVEKYYKPAIMLTTVDGIATGSARSIPGINLFELFKSCSDILIDYGGHAAAAGISLELYNVDTLIERLKNYISSNYKDDIFIQSINIDASINFKDITPKFLKYLNMLTPFGPQNTKPVFMTENIVFCKVKQNPGNNIIAFIRQDNSKLSLEAIGYGLADKIEIDFEKKYDIVYSIDTVKREDLIIPQIIIKDIRYHQES